MVTIKNDYFELKSSYICDDHDQLWPLLYVLITTQRYCDEAKLYWNDKSYIIIINQYEYQNALKRK